MASATANAPPKDVTFRQYSDGQAAMYAKNRPGYPPALIDFIVDRHRATGGQTGVLLDVGCGPGSATRALSPYFDAAWGADAGDAMIKAGTDIGGTTAGGVSIQYRVCPAENIDTIEGIEHGSVDMITAATAAHWFEMPKFWAAAARLLKPGGSVAIWTVFRDRSVEPPSPVASQIFQLMNNFYDVVLGPHKTPGNRLAEAGYEGMPMPWDDPATTALFEKDTFLRKVFSKEGNSMYRERWANEADPAVFFKLAEAGLSTLGPVSRWREAHPDLAGTDEDCVKVVMKQVHRIVEEATEPFDFKTLVDNMPPVLLFVKRSK